MTGIIVGVCIALTCIVMCALILINKGRPRYWMESHGSKTFFRHVFFLTFACIVFKSFHIQKFLQSQSLGSGRRWRSTRWSSSAQRTPPGDHWGPDAHDKFSLYWHKGEMNDHCSSMSWAKRKLLSSLLLSFQVGTNMVINGAGPVSSKGQGKSWLLLKRDVASPPGSDVSAWHFMFRHLPFPRIFQSQFNLCLQDECRASLYQPGKTVLRYEKHFGSAPVPSSSKEIVYGPFHSESSHGSDGSQETADSGHYSNEESNEEMSNPSTGQHSRPQSFGLDDLKAELKPSFTVENEEVRSQTCHRSAPDLPRSCCIVESVHPAPNTPEGADSWRRSADTCADTSTSDHLLRNEAMERQLLLRRWWTHAFASDLPQDFVCVDVTAFLFHFLFFFKSYLSVFGIVCSKPKLTHDECQKEC